MREDSPPENPVSLPAPGKRRHYRSGTLAQEAKPELPENKPAFVPDSTDGVPVLRGRWEAWAVASLGLLLLMAGLLFLLSTMNGKVQPLPEPKESKDMVLARRDMETDARATLRGFLAAPNAARRREFLLGAAGKRSETGFRMDFEEGLSEELFAVSPSSSELSGQGMYAMIFERPAALGMESYPRPITRLEVELGLEPGGWLEYAEHKDIGNRAQRGERVSAFFKRIDGRLLLDWEIWSQSGSRALEKFSAAPDSPPATFRVLIGPMHPAVSRKFGKTTGRWFWIEDPSYENLRHAVEAPPEIARQILAMPAASAPEGSPPLAATLELEWKRETESIVVSRLVTWGFPELEE